MDRSIRPGDDFFGFANGAWFKATDIAPDRSSAGVWASLADEAASETRDILEQASTRGPSATAEERQIGDYYASYMDEAAIEKKGIAPLEPFMKSIAAIDNRPSLVRYVCGELRTDVDALNSTNFQTDRLFGLWIAQDLNAPTQYVTYILQGGLGMPDRDYYVDPSPEMGKVRDSYRHHIAAMLTRAGIDDVDARAERIFRLERQIAAAHATRTDSVDVHKANNPWQRDEFPRRAPGLDWSACFDAAGLGAESHFIVWQPAAITGIAALVEKTPIETWRDYLTFHLIDRYGSVLPKAFVDERFAFYGQVLSGTPQLRDRWKRAVDATNAALGDTVGKLYVHRFFPPEHKAQLESMVARIVSAFSRRIDRLSWMNPSTKASAKAKLAALIVGIGYPDRWRDESPLQVVRGDALMNRYRAELFDYQYNRAKLGRRVDRTEWAMTPQTVNALNLPAMNALNFPAAILKPPFYDAQAGPAVIYAAIGAVIGHEISHSFDDQGSQFDASGKLANWWTPEDFAHFTAASAKLVQEFNAYEPLPGVHVNGQLTLSENIADVAGLSAAYDAYRETSGTTARQHAGGFSADQAFFLSWGQVWRTKMREPLLRQLIVTDGHPPDRYRCDTVRNIDAWYDAFGVKAGEQLYLAEADRVRVW